MNKGSYILVKKNSRTADYSKYIIAQLSSEDNEEEMIYLDAEFDYGTILFNIASCLLKIHLEPENRSHIDECSQHLFASKHSTCVQWDCIPANMAAGKSSSASIFLRFDTRLLFYETPLCP